MVISSLIRKAPRSFGVKEVEGHTTLMNVYILIYEEVVFSLAAAHGRRLLRYPWLPRVGYNDGKTFRSTFKRF